MSTVKVIRGQVRQVVKEELEGEISKAILAKLQKQNEDAFKHLQSIITEKLAEMDDRAKTVQNYILRQLDQAAANPPPKTGLPNE